MLRCTWLVALVCAALAPAVAHACSCAFDRREVRFLTPSGSLPADAKGVLVQATNTRTTLSASLFTALDETTGQSVPLTLRWLEAGPLDFVPEKSLRDRAGLFRLEPARFVAGHVYAFTLGTQPVQRLEVTISTARVGKLRANELVVEASAPQLGPRAFSAGSMCSDTRLAVSTYLRFKPPARLAAWKAALRVVPQDQQAPTVTTLRHRSSMCEQEEWGKPSGGTEESIVVPCEKELETRAWKVGGWWAFLEVDSTHLELPTLSGTIRTETACSLQSAIELGLANPSAISAMCELTDVHALSDPLRKRLVERALTDEALQPCLLGLLGQSLEGQTVSPALRPVAPRLLDLLLTRALTPQPPGNPLLSALKAVRPTGRIPPDPSDLFRAFFPADPAPERLLTRLRGALDGDDPGVRERAVVYLGVARPKGYGGMVAAMKHPTHSAPAVVASDVDDAAARARLFAWVDAADPELGVAAATAVLTLPPAVAVPDEVVVHVTQLMGRDRRLSVTDLRDRAPQAVPALRELAWAGDEPGRQARHALAGLKAEPDLVIETCLRDLAARELWTQQRALDDLDLLGDPRAAEPLWKAARSSNDTRVQLRALQWLERHGTPAQRTAAAREVRSSHDASIRALAQKLIDAR